MNLPTDVDVKGAQLFVGDTANNRVLVWDTFPTANGTPAIHVLGQSDFVHLTANDDNQDGVTDAGPTGRTLNRGGSFALWVRAFGNKVLVGDPGNSRVLIFEGM